MEVSERKFKLIYIAIVLVTVSFIGGFYLHVPIRRSFIRSKITKEVKAEEQRFVEKFLDKKAPDISTKTLDGEDWSLYEQRGKVVLVFFWATTCPFCIDMLPEIRGIYERYSHREDFLVVAVSLDKDRDMLFCFTSIKEIPWVQLYEEGKEWDNSFAQAFDIRSTPSVWIIDKDSTVRGFHLRGEEIVNMLDMLLDEDKIDIDNNHFWNTSLN